MKAEIQFDILLIRSHFNGVGTGMEKIILSLKNIYMTLMTEDFPIYSESVIGRADRKGQTMLRFWQGQIAPEFRSQPCGRMIWRNDGKRNRYTSYLCNRKLTIFFVLVDQMLKSAKD